MELALWTKPKSTSVSTKQANFWMSSSGPEYECWVGGGGKQVKSWVSQGCVRVEVLGRMWGNAYAYASSIREIFSPHCKYSALVKGSSIGDGYVAVVQLLKSCPTLCNPMNCSTPGFPVLHSSPQSLLRLMSIHKCPHYQRSCPRWFFSGMLSKELGSPLLSAHPWGSMIYLTGASQVAQVVKNPPANAEDRRH